MNPEVAQYLEELYRRSGSPADAAPVMQSPGVVDDLPLASLATGEDIPQIATPEQVGAIEAAGYAAKAKPQPQEMKSYLDALAAAQERDRMAAGFAGALAGVEQAAQIASRGLYRPAGMPRMPSAVAELEQRQKAVEDYLERQRGLRAETRAERASEAQMELARGQAAREQARTKAEELRLAIEANEAPERVQKLRAETMAALERANLYGKQAEAAAKGKQPRLVVGGAPSKPAKEPKAQPARPLPATETRELADFAVAEGELDSLLASFEKRNMAGALSGMAAKGGEMLGMKGTESAAYMADARRAMQAVGTILEGGKLAAGDELKYRRMLPEAGDSLEIARGKVSGLKKYLSDLKAKRTEAFRAGGFQVGEQAPAAAAAPQRSPLASAAEAAVQAVENAKRAGKPKSEIDALIKQAEAAIEAASREG